MFLDLPERRENFFPKDTIISRWFRNEKYTPWAQIIASLTLGIFLSPWALGIFYLFIFLLLYELFYYIYTIDSYHWQADTRAVVILSYILGFFIGRSLFFEADVVVKSDIPDPKNLPVWNSSC